MGWDGARSGGGRVRGDRCGGGLLGVFCCYHFLEMAYVSFVRVHPSVRRTLCVQIALSCFRPWLGRLREAMKSMRCHPEAMTRLLHIIVDKSKSHNQPRDDGRQKCHVTLVSNNDILTPGHFVTHVLGKRGDKHVMLHFYQPFSRKRV